MLYIYPYRQTLLHSTIYWLPCESVYKLHQESLSGQRENVFSPELQYSELTGFQDFPHSQRKSEYLVSKTKQTEITRSNTIKCLECYRPKQQSRDPYQSAKWQSLKYFEGTQG